MMESFDGGDDDDDDDDDGDERLVAGGGVEVMRSRRGERTSSNSKTKNKISKREFFKKFEQWESRSICTHDREASGTRLQLAALCRSL